MTTDRQTADPFADDVLERLARSNQDYQRAHGHYIVPLAERLLEARARLVQVEQERDAAESDAKMCAEALVDTHGRLVQVEAALERLASLEGFEGAGIADGGSFAERELRARGKFAVDALAALRVGRNDE